jgi:hypothetical protein
MTTNTSIGISTDGAVEVDTIDYDKETGPFWYVEVDGTPVLPERPLPLEHALAVFRREVAEAAEYDSTVELRQCDDSDLKWAGIDHA